MDVHRFLAVRVGDLVAMRRTPIKQLALLRATE